MTQQQSEGERVRLDELLSTSIDEFSRLQIWSSSSRVLDHSREALTYGGSRTITVLGYVQSGKTTAMSALMALACDERVELVIALLGTTTLLLDQNSSRLSTALGIQSRSDYRWTEIKNPRTKSDARQIGDWISKGRTVFVPLLKHSQRIDALRRVLEDPRLSNSRILIIDDEADQASPNTLTRTLGESRTHEALTRLRSVCTRHSFVQFTATPYALLLIDRGDSLYPDVVEILEPGRGYTGGKEFFIDSRAELIHPIPRGDEQGAQLPITLPQSLKQALAAFLVGAADLLLRDSSNAPVSMLIHPHSKTTVQERYRFLLQNHLEDLREVTKSATTLHHFGEDFVSQKKALENRILLSCDESEFLKSLKSAVNECHVSLLNSKTDLKGVQWNESPVHILIGGNKLDRGFTVEGLTVTYMNRSASDQIDTTEQRARAFGYRRDYLPYCQFFASTRTIDLLTDVVRTETDLRQELSDAFHRGETVKEWSQTVGLLLPEDSKPTRDAVVRAVTTNQLGWHYVRKPAFDKAVVSNNRAVIEQLGLLDAPVEQYGRLQFPSIRVTQSELITSILEPWAAPDFSPNWQRQYLLDAVSRTVRFMSAVKVILLDAEESGVRRPREREWRDDIGFVNIFQGRDNASLSNALRYPGDRSIGEEAFRGGELMLQIHRLRIKNDGSNVEYLVPAIFLGNRRLVRTLT